MLADLKFDRIAGLPYAAIPNLNSRKQISQGFLELFRFFHNTHRFVRGKRMGSSPLELAGGSYIDDPLAFLGLGEKS